MQPLYCPICGKEFGLCPHLELEVESYLSDHDLFNVVDPYEDAPNRPTWAVKQYLLNNDDAFDLVIERLARCSPKDRLDTLQQTFWVDLVHMPQEHEAGGYYRHGELLRLMLLQFALSWVNWRYVLRCFDNLMSSFSPNPLTPPVLCPTLFLEDVKGWHNPPTGLVGTWLDMNLEFINQLKGWLGEIDENQLSDEVHNTLKSSVIAQESAQQIQDRLNNAKYSTRRIEVLAYHILRFAGLDNEPQSASSELLAWAIQYINWTQIYRFLGFVFPPAIAQSDPDGGPAVVNLSLRRVHISGEGAYLTGDPMRLINNCLHRQQ